MPSAAPANIVATNVQRTQITFAWNEVPCGLRHGNIIEYRYTFNSDDEMQHSDVFTRQITFPNLSPGTAYTFNIAASNGAGRGVFGVLTTSTVPSKYVNPHFPKIFLTARLPARRYHPSQCFCCKVSYSFRPLSIGTAHIPIAFHLPSQ